jgi:DNA-binding LacI/PurR family transcriptional regulator
MSKVHSIETKCAEKVIEAMDNHWFNPTIMARALVNGCGHYTQSKVMDLVVEIIKQVNGQFDNAWEEGETSEALLMASRLNDMIDNFETIDV